MGFRIIDRKHSEEFVQERLSQLRHLVEDQEQRQGAYDSLSMESKLVELMRKIEAAKLTISNTSAAQDAAAEVGQELKEAPKGPLDSIAGFEAKKILELL